MREASANDKFDDLLIGSWVLAPGDPRFGILGVTITYADDGRVRLVIYDTPSCDSPQYIAEGRWSVEQDLIAIILTRSSDSSILPVGHRRIERIIELDGELMIVQSEVSGNLLYRLRADTCFSVT